MTFRRLTSDVDADASEFTTRSMACMSHAEISHMIGEIRTEVRWHDNYDRDHLLSEQAEELNLRIQEVRIQSLNRRSYLTRDLRRPRSGW